MIVLDEGIAERLENEDAETYNMLEEFLRGFDQRDINHLKNTAIPDCVAFFLRFYSQRFAIHYSQLACSALQDSLKDEALQYLEKAGFYFQKLSNSR